MVFRAIAVSLALAGVQVQAAEEERKTECKAGCVCGQKHPTMDLKSHPMQVCEVNVQGFDFSLMSPDDENGKAWWPGGLFQTDLPRFLEPKVLPPWGQNATAPISLLPIKPGSVVLDLGAGYGMFSLLVAKAFTDVKVIAVEPLGWQADLIEENAKRNGLADRVKVVRKPITKDGRKVEYFQQVFWPALSNIYSKALRAEAHVDERTTHGNPNVESLTLKQVLATEGFTGELSFAHIDCVGCENELLDQITELDIPFELLCWGGIKNSYYAGRFWNELHSLTHIQEKEGEKCLDVQDLGENKMLWPRADEGMPVEQSIIGLHTLAEGNRSGAIHELAKVIKHAPYDFLPLGGIREQYAILAEAAKAIAGFFVAGALETGEEFPQDTAKAVELFQAVAASEGNLLQADADLSILHQELPMLADVQSGSMFRLGEIAAKQGSLDQAKEYWTQASQMGHAIAAARLDAFPHTDLTGTNGWISGNWKRQLMTHVQLEALGIPAALHQPLLGSAAASMYDECMRRDQEKGVARWEDVFAGKGQTYEAMGAYRFRSWLVSAMSCWLGAN